jgi:hypothetical protein
MDLYRLTGTSRNEFDPLPLPDGYGDSITLIEWPGRLASFPDLLPPFPCNRLDVDLRIRPRSDERIMTLSGRAFCDPNDHKQRHQPDESSWGGRLESLVNEGMVDDLLLSYHAAGDESEVKDAERSTKQ